MDCAPRSPATLRALLPALALLAASLAMTAALAVRPRPDASALGLFAPGLGRDGALGRAAAAGVRVIAPGRLPASLVVPAEDAGRLGAAGAWLVLDAAALGGCLLAAP